MQENNYSLFIKRLQSSMEVHGIKQVHLAKELGVTEGAVSKLLKGETNPHLGTFIKLCEVLCVSPNYLLGYKEMGAESSELRHLRVKMRRIRTIVGDSK